MRKSMLLWLANSFSKENLPGGHLAGKLREELGGSLSTSQTLAACFTAASQAAAEPHG